MREPSHPIQVGVKRKRVASTNENAHGHGRPTRSSHKRKRSTTTVTKHHISPSEDSESEASEMELDPPSRQNSSQTESEEEMEGDEEDEDEEDEDEDDEDEDEVGVGNPGVVVGHVGVEFVDPFVTVDPNDVDLDAGYDPENDPELQAILRRAAEEGEDEICYEPEPDGHFDGMPADEAHFEREYEVRQEFALD